MCYIRLKNNIINKFNNELCLGIGGNPSGLVYRSTGLKFKGFMPFGVDPFFMSRALIDRRESTRLAYISQTWICACGLI